MQQGKATRTLTVMVCQALLTMVMLQIPPGRTEVQPTEVQAPEEKESGFDAIAIPLPNFNSDLGFGIGVAGGAFFYKKGYYPYRHAIAAEVYFTTRGVQNHFIEYDGPDLLPGVRLEARVQYLRQIFSPYYGPGNLTAPGFSSVPGRKDRFFSYDQVVAGGRVRARLSPFGKHHAFHPYIGYAYNWYRVRTYANSLLREQPQRGVNGGPAGHIQLGAFWDTRNDEANPTTGGTTDLSLQIFARPFGSRFTYVQLTLSGRRFITLGSHLVLANRVAFDALFGDIPFYAWDTTDGLNFFGGIGGVSSVRGVTLNRYSGDYKAVGNSELRWLPIGFQLLKVETRVGTSAFFDLGRAWQPGVDNGSFFHWHLGSGVGLRLVRRQVVVRADFAVWLATGHKAFYITFANPF